jgi:hypothetical protein
MTRKGGSTIISDNDEVIEPVNDILLGLGFESEELEMIEPMSQNEIINRYIDISYYYLLVLATSSTNYFYYF